MSEKTGEKEEEVSRRGFLRIIGAGAGGLALSAFGTEMFDRFLKDKSHENSGKLQIEAREDDPESPEEGDIWLRMDI
jgi:hypothetical protein